jgi:hypothetical protein
MVAGMARGRAERAAARAGTARSKETDELLEKRFKELDFRGTGKISMLDFTCARSAAQRVRRPPGVVMS